MQRDTDRHATEPTNQPTNQPQIHDVAGCTQLHPVGADEKAKNPRCAASVPSLPALGPWAPPAERVPSLESIYRVSLTVDLCEG